MRPMLFTIRHCGLSALDSGEPAASLSLSRRSSAQVASLALALSLACASVAVAQPAPPSLAAPAASASGQAAALPAAQQAPVGTPAPDVDHDDPVSRFLADKGLLPSTKPVMALAQQVRDKATDVASELVLSAMNFLGVPYRRGGTSRESGFDCSGFTRHVFENSVGLILPRRAAEQANSPDLVPVQKNELKPGDLVFFNTLRHTFSHVGIYIGDDKFIHSPRSGGKVRVEDMRQAYWQQRFDGARRAPGVAARQSNAGGNN